MNCTIIIDFAFSLIALYLPLQNDLTSNDLRCINFIKYALKTMVWEVDTNMVCNCQAFYKCIVYMRSKTDHCKAFGLKNSNRMSSGPTPKRTPFLCHHHIVVSPSLLPRVSRFASFMRHSRRFV